MNANFERSGIFPFSTRPSDNFKGGNPTGEYVITHVEKHEQAVHLGINGEIEFVDFSRATMFPNVVEAVRAASKLQ